MLELPLGTGNVQQLTGAFDFINSYGHGSYNAGFVTFKTTNWHGWTTQSNFTWGRALGTGSVVQASSSITVPNPYDFKNFGTYGVQPFDVKYTYSLLMYYHEPWYKDQKGLLGRVLGGWTVAPLFTARTGLPLRVQNGGDAQSFGEIYSGQSANYENAAGAAPFTGGSSQTGFYNQTSPSVGSSENPAKGGSGINLFNNPTVVASEFRPLVLGVDTNTSLRASRVPVLESGLVGHEGHQSHGAAERATGDPIGERAESLRAVGSDGEYSIDEYVRRGDESVHQRQRCSVAVDGVRVEAALLRQLWLARKRALLRLWPGGRLIFLDEADYQSAAGCQPAPHHGAACKAALRAALF